MKVERSLQSSVLESKGNSYVKFFLILHLTILEAIQWPISYGCRIHMQQVDVKYRFVHRRNNWLAWF